MATMPPAKQAKTQQITPEQWAVFDEQGYVVLEPDQVNTAEEAKALQVRNALPRLCADLADATCSLPPVFGKTALICGCSSCSVDPDGLLAVQYSASPPTRIASTRS